MSSYRVVNGKLTDGQKAFLDKKFGTKSASVEAPKSFAADQSFTVANFTFQETATGKKHTLALKSGDKVKPESLVAYLANVESATADTKSIRARGREPSSFHVYLDEEPIGFGALPRELRENPADLAFAMTALNENGLTMEFATSDPPMYVNLDKSPKVTPLDRDLSIQFTWYATGIDDSISGRRGDKIVKPFAAHFVRQQSEYDKVMAAFDRVGLKPKGFVIRGEAFTSDKPTKILAAPDDAERFIDEFGSNVPLWPKVGEMPDGKFRSVAAGCFPRYMTADEMAWFAARLAAEGYWFDFVPTTWDKFTDDEAGQIQRSAGYWEFEDVDDVGPVSFGSQPLSVNV